MGLKCLKVGRRGASEQGNGEAAAESPIRQDLLWAYKSRWILFSRGRSEKSVFNPSVGTRLLLGHLESIYVIAYTASQLSVNLCPQTLFTEKPNSRAGGVWSDKAGGHRLHATFSCETARNGRKQESGRQRTRSNQGLWGDKLLGQDGGGTTPTWIPARSSFEARFQEDPISLFCFFTRLCCPAQCSDGCYFIRLFRTESASAPGLGFAVHDLQ